MEGHGFNFTVADLKKLADEHLVTFVGVHQGNYPFGPVYIIIEPQPSHLMMSEFESRVQERRAPGTEVKIAWAG